MNIECPLSVCMLAANLSRRAGGLSETIPATSFALKELGLKIRMLGLADEELPASEELHNEIQTSLVSSLATPGMRIAPSLDRVLKQFSPDVLHLNGLWLYPSVATLKWRLRTRRAVVISPHGMLDPWALRNSLWKKRLALKLFEIHNLRGALCLHALNQNELSAFRALGLKNPVAVIPNGVDLPNDHSEFKPPAFLANDERKVILFLGRMHPKKGLVETLKAWSEVQKQNPLLANDWVLVLAGWDDGGHVDILKQLTKNLGLNGAVVFAGPVFGQEKERLLAHSNAFILASHSEGLPMAILEAWAHSVPVLMTRACNIPEGFEAGAALEIPTEPKQMAGILGNALSDPQLPTLGAAGRELVERHFTWSKVAHELSGVYSWICKKGPRPECVDTI